MALFLRQPLAFAGFVVERRDVVVDVVGSCCNSCPVFERAAQAQS
jgi:hypothetical protein